MSPPPVVAIPAEELGQAPEFLPILPDRVLASLLTIGRALLSGPNRASFAVVFDGDMPVHCQFCTDAPEASNDQFCQDYHRVWHSYSVGRTIPVVICRFSPTPFAGIMVVPLPWAIVNTFCARCGSVDHHVACQ